MRRRFLAVGLLGLFAALLGYRYWTRPPEPVALPAIDLTGAEPALIDAVESARADVLADSGSASAWGRLGMLLGANAYFEQSAACFENAIRLEPGNPKWVFYEAMQYLNQARVQESIPRLRRAAETAPGRKERSACLFFLATAQINLGRVEDAEQTAGELEELEPDTARIAIVRGSIAVLRGNAAEARRLLLALAEHPNARKRVCEQLAQTVDPRTGQPITRLEACAAMPPDRPWPNAYMEEMMRLRINRSDRLELFHDLVRRGRPEEAFDHLTRLSIEDPDAEILTLFGAEQSGRKNHGEAERTFRRSLELDAKNPRTHLLLATALYEQGRYEDAVKSANSALHLQASLSQAQSLSGRAFVKMKRRNEAVEAFRNAVLCRPESAEHHLELGEALADGGDVKGGLASMETALKLAPSDPRVQKAIAVWKPKAK